MVLLNIVKMNLIVKKEKQVRQSLWVEPYTVSALIGFG